MRKLLAAILLLAGLNSFSANYYLSPTGSDANNGTASGTPWLTYTNAHAHLVAGDTLNVLPGYYFGAGNGVTNYFTITTSGTTASPITYIASGAVTNEFAFSVNASNIVLSGFTWSGLTTNNANIAWNPAATYPAVFMLRSGSYLTITNCNFVGMSGWTLDPSGGTGITPIAADNVSADAPFGIQAGLHIVGCNFGALSNAVCIETMGTNQIIEKCFAHDLAQSQFMRPVGSNIVIQSCTISNIFQQGSGFHPDIVQVFGDGGFTTCGMLFQKNTILSCVGVQILQSGFWSAGLPGPGNSYTWAVTNYAWWGITFQNNLWSYSSLQASANVPNVNFYNNTFYRCNTGAQAGSGFQYVYDALTNSASTNLQNTGWAYGGHVENNLFDECNSSTFVEYSTIPQIWGTNANYPNGGPITWTNPYPPVDLVADYNFDCGTNGATKTGFSEVHGITGQDPLLACTTNGNFQPLFGSPLIDAGTNLSGVTNDFFGSARPLGNAKEIGFVEFDSNLVLRVDFDEPFAAGRLRDITGYGHDAWNMQGTNWIISTNGALGTTAGYWATNGVDSNGAGGFYTKSTYAAITNVSGLTNLHKMTFSVWTMTTNTSQQSHMFVVSSGYDVANALNKSACSNSWTFGRDFQSFFSFIVNTSTGGDTRILDWPDDTIQPGGGTPNMTQTNWMFYTAVIDCDSNTIIGYTNGVPFKTNSVGVPYLTVYGNPSLWLAIGAWPHDGTPAWGDDLYPNDSYFAGAMDDVRIYTRTLSAAEVANLYTGRGAALVSSGGGGGGGTGGGSPAPSQTVLGWGKYGWMRVGN